MLITSSTYRQIADLVVARRLDAVTFKGVEEDIELYDVTGMKAPYNLTLPEASVAAKALRSPLTVTLRRIKGKLMLAQEMKLC